jgi:hypothetical protein
MGLCWKGLARLSSALMTFDALQYFFRGFGICRLPTLLNFAKYVCCEPITAVGFFIRALAGIAGGVRIGAGYADIYDGRSATRIASEAFDRKYFAVTNEFVCVVFDTDYLIADLKGYIFHGIISFISKHGQAIVTYVQ